MFHYITIWYVYIYIAIYHYGIYIYYTLHLRYVSQHSIHFWWWHCHATSGKFQESRYFDPRGRVAAGTIRGSCSVQQWEHAVKNETRHTHTHNAQFVLVLTSSFKTCLRLWSFPEHCQRTKIRSSHGEYVLDDFKAFSGAIMAGVESSLSSLCIS